MALETFNKWCSEYPTVMQNLFSDVDFFTSIGFDSTQLFYYFKLRYGERLVAFDFDDGDTYSLVASIKYITLKYNYKYTTLMGTIGLEYNPIENYNMVELGGTFATKGNETNKTTQTLNTKNTVENKQTTSNSNTTTDENTQSVDSTNNSYGTSYDSTEAKLTGKTTSTGSGKNSTTTTADGSGSNTTNATAANTGTISNDTTTSYEKTGNKVSANDNVYGKEVDTNDYGGHKLTRSGNIGITTTQQMLESERAVARSLDIIDEFFNDVKKEILIGYWN